MFLRETAPASHPRVAEAELPRITVRRCEALRTINVGLRRSFRNESRTATFSFIPASWECVKGPVRLASRPLAPEFSSGQSGRSVVPDLFDRRRIRSQPTFHGRVSTNRADTGFQNYLNLTADNQKVHIFLDGVEQHAVTADPDTG